GMVVRPPGRLGRAPAAIGARAGSGITGHLAGRGSHGAIDRVRLTGTRFYNPGCPLGRHPPPAGSRHRSAHKPSDERDLTDTAHHFVAADLVAVLVAVTDGAPRVLTTRRATALPSGPLERSHRSLQAGLRAWVEAQTHHPLGYVEQLY